MKTRNGRILWAALVTGSTALLLGTGALAFLPRAAKPVALPIQTVPLNVFCAPSHVPAGEHWVIVGSMDVLPADVVVTAAAAGVEILEVQKTSKRAIGVRLTSSLGVQGKLLRVESASANNVALPDLYQGQTPASKTEDGNFTPEDFVNGKLVVDGQHLMYGYFPEGEAALAAVRIHNRRTGEWHCHEHALKAAREAAEEEAKVPVPPHFVAVDELDTLPDTDGNGVPDFADTPFEKPAVPEQIGVEIMPQDNVLDIVSLDENGVAAWRTITVHSTFVPETGQ